MGGGGHFLHKSVTIYNASFMQQGGGYVLNEAFVTLWKRIYLLLQNIVLYFVFVCRTQKRIFKKIVLKKLFQS